MKHRSVCTPIALMFTVCIIFGGIRLCQFTHPFPPVRKLPSGHGRNPNISHPVGSSLWFLFSSAGLYLGSMPITRQRGPRVPVYIRFVPFSPLTCRPGPRPVGGGDQSLAATSPASVKAESTSGSHHCGARWCQSSCAAT